MLFNEIVLWGNSLERVFVAIIFFIVLVFVFKFFFYFLIKKVKKITQKTVTEIDDFALGLLKTIKPPIYYFISFYLAFLTLTTSEKIDKIARFVFIVVVVWQIVQIFLRVIDYVIDKQTEKSDKTDSGQKTILKFLKQIIKGGVWIVGVLMILANLGVNVTSLVAGLGIGGLAIAMALKNILTDIFSSFSILIDKPFVVGDFIALNDKHQGTVKKIGIKTTRLETKDGQELVVANKKLTEQVVMNFRGKDGKKTRNISFFIGVVYETPLEKLKKIPQIVKSVTLKQKNTELKKVVFDNFGDFSLNFKVVITVRETAKKNVAETKNKLNYSLFEAFIKEGIEFAYPTQKVFLNKDLEN